MIDDKRISRLLTDACPYCGGKLEDFGCGGPGYPEWRCVGSCASEFRKE